MLNEKIHRSNRFQSTPIYDVDAYLLEEGDWFLFVTIKSLTGEFKAIREEIMPKFTRGKIRLISGALKTKDKSEPLIPVLIDQNAKLADFVWTHDYGIQFRLETKNVLNPGLFLDQELNRLKLVEIIQAKRKVKPKAGALKLLNLFSYTGAFSVLASCHGVETTSADISGRYIDWEKKNHGQNTEQKKLEWGQTSYPVLHLVREDARDFLRKKVAKNDKYDFIIIDPPTFSRGEAGAFKVQTDLPTLADSALKILAPGGVLFLSTNDSTWDQKDFYSQFENLAKQNMMTTQCGELPEEYLIISPAYSLKTIWIFK